MEISQDLTSFSYSYLKCIKKFLGFCKEHALETETVLFTDKEKIKELRDMNFVLKVRELP